MKQSPTTPTPAKKSRLSVSSSYSMSPNYSSSSGSRTSTPGGGRQQQQQQQRQHSTSSTSHRASSDPPAPAREEQEKSPTTGDIETQSPSSSSRRTSAGSSSGSGSSHQHPERHHPPERHQEQQPQPSPVQHPPQRTALGARRIPSHSPPATQQQQQQQQQGGGGTHNNHNINDLSSLSTINVSSLKAGGGLVKIDTSPLVDVVLTLVKTVKEQQQTISEMKLDMHKMDANLKLSKSEAVSAVSTMTQKVERQINDFRLFLGENGSEEEQEGGGQQQHHHHPHQEIGKRKVGVSTSSTLSSQEGEEIVETLPRLHDVKAFAAPKVQLNLQVKTTESFSLVPSRTATPPSFSSLSSSKPQQQQQQQQQNETKTAPTPTASASATEAAATVKMILSTSAQNTPYEKLPPAIRNSFQFVRSEYKTLLDSLETRMNDKIEDMVTKTVTKLVDEMDSREKALRGQLQGASDQKIANVSRSFQDRISDLANSVMRNEEKSEEAETTLRTNLCALTTLVQRMDRRVIERFEGVDSRDTSIETVLQQLMEQFDDVTNRIMPLVGGTAMDEAVSAIKPLRQVLQGNKERKATSSSSSSSSFTPSSATASASSTVGQPQQQQEQVKSNDDSNKDDEKEFVDAIIKASSAGEGGGGEGEGNASPAVLSKSALQVKQQQLEQQQQKQKQQPRNPTQLKDEKPIPSSLVGSIDVEVLANHDARAIAMLHTAPFVALRHQVLQDTKMRIATARDSILGELDEHLESLRNEIVRRPLPSRVAEMIRDLTASSQIPEQLAKIRSQMQTLENNKLAHHQFNDAMKTKADITLMAAKADSAETDKKLGDMVSAIGEVKQQVDSVQSERSQFRLMLREVLYMHRRAQALSGGADTHFSAANDFLVGDGSFSLVDESRGGSKTTSSSVGQDIISSAGSDVKNVLGLIDPSTSQSLSSMQVRDPALPLVQQSNAYEISDPIRAQDPRKMMMMNNSNNTSLSPPQTAPSGVSPRHSRRNNNNNNNNDNNSSSKAPSTLRREASLRKEKSSVQQPQQQQGSSGSSSSSSSGRRAQQLVDSIVGSPPATAASASSSSSSSTSGARRGSTSQSARSAKQNNNNNKIADLQEVGSRDMSQKVVRKVFTPTKGELPLDL